MNVTILGAAGAVGRLLVRRLVDHGCAVTALDVVPHAPYGAAIAVAADATTDDLEAQAVVQTADAVVICLPEAVAPNALPLLTAMPRGALLVDTLSVKAPFATRAAAALPDRELLGISLMFRPELDVAGRNVVATNARRGPRSDQFVQLFRAWGALISEMSPEDHDRAAAQIQAMTHATILAFGGALRASRYDIARVAAMWTPPHRALLSLLARLVSGESHVYWSIQHDNRYAVDARRHLRDAWRQFDALAQDADPAGFDRAIADLRALLGPHLGTLEAAAGRLTEI